MPILVDADAPSLGHPTGHCLTRFHDLCPGSVARNANHPDKRLTCACGCHQANTQADTKATA